MRAAEPRAAYTAMIGPGPLHRPFPGEAALAVLSSTGAEALCLRGSAAGPVDFVHYDDLATVAAIGRALFARLG